MGLFNLFALVVVTIVVVIGAVAGLSLLIVDQVRPVGERGAQSNRRKERKHV